jgi:glycogen operon protein
MKYTMDYGVHFIDEAVNGLVEVSLWAPEATKIEFCLFEKAGNAWIQTRIEILEDVGFGNWSGRFSGIFEGQHYGFRVHGKWDPDNGFFFNPAKLLVDPYAKAIEGTYNYCEAVLAYESTRNELGQLVPELHDGKLVPNTQDSAPHIPHSVVIASADGCLVESVIDPKKTVKPSIKPQTPWAKTVIYEAHVVGFTKLAPWLPDYLKGTYAGLGHPSTIEYLQKLGITAIELLPIHSKISEAHLIHNGLENYWGYSNLSYFAPEPSYATKRSQENGACAIVHEVKEMVNALHNAGIEVILDVVYNHSCEESKLGPTLSYRGIANRQYYVHQPDDFGTLDDTTGCGNSFNFRDSHIVKMAHDSLKYWADPIEGIGVDGFRFDLMVTCARGETGFSAEHPFLEGIRNDQLLGNCKMIAEPWDLGLGGWRTGGFGLPFSEWNDSFRNTTRQFWLTDFGRTKLGYSVSPPQDLATRLSGSSDIFSPTSKDIMRGPYASINYIAAHDGFTLRDLVSYNNKHNEANLEDNRDGSTDNSSFNHGAEGVSQDLNLKSERRQSMRNMLATLLLSTGVPMLVAGDELGRTQGGNNNAYCQNNEISWIDWGLEQWQNDQIESTASLIQIKKSFPALQRSNFFKGIPQEIRQDIFEHRETADPVDVADLCWFHFDGSIFSPTTWNNTEFRAFQAFFSATHDGSENSERDVLIVINGTNNPNDIQLPELRQWEYLWSSKHEKPKKQHKINKFTAPEFSLSVFASLS